ncbi:MAG: 50S ribosomal protein L10 [Nanoarchaeota archaeon]
MTMQQAQKKKKKAGDEYVNGKRVYKAHVSEKKKQTVEEFKKLIEKYSIIAVLDLENLPARQLQVMKETLRDTVLIKMTKRRYLNLILDQSPKKDVLKLKPYLKGMPALLFTNESPFKLYSIIKKSKSNAPIKGGQKAPKEIMVRKGLTSFAPGPVIGELGQFKIKTMIEGGKVAIKEDSVVAKEGDVVSQKLASILQRLGIEPMEIGLDVVAVFENGEILTKDVLDVDETAYYNNFMAAYRSALGIALETAYAAPETIGPLIMKAHRAAHHISVENSIITQETLAIILARAEGIAAGIAAQTN